MPGKTNPTQAEALTMVCAQVMGNDVSVFRPYPFKKGQKIFIDGSKRSGDWEVVDVSQTKLTLRCPISKKEFKWDRFCYYVEDKKMKWPKDQDYISG